MIFDFFTTFSILFFFNTKNLRDAYFAGILRVYQPI